MKVRLYPTVRDLHLYLGLFASPFVLLFSVTVFYFVHRSLLNFSQDSSAPRTVSRLPLPTDLSTLSGQRLIEALQPALRAAGVPGEVGFIQHNVAGKTLIIPVTIPGRETTLTIQLTTGDGTVVTREKGFANALVTLHRSPGPHGPGIRMNWVYMQVWRWLADATVYLILFITLSGVYLWYVLRAERLIGYILLSAGALCFFAMTYALSH